MGRKQDLLAGELAVRAAVRAVRGKHYVENAISAALNGNPAALAAVILVRDLDQTERRWLAAFVMEIVKRAKRRPRKTYRADVVAVWDKIKAEAKQKGEPRPNSKKYAAVVSTVLAKRGIKVAETTIKNDLARSRKNIKAS